MKILIGWELGTGLGHIAIIAPLAKKLADIGHNVTLYISEKPQNINQLAHNNIEIKLLPKIKNPKIWDNNARTNTLADIFFLSGMNEENYILEKYNLWNNILRNEKPDLVITELAPFLNFTAYKHYPLIVLGSGYDLPPTNRELPNIRFWQEELDIKSQEYELLTLDNFNKVRKKIGLDKYHFFSDIFKGDKEFVCSIKELDCYAKYRANPAIGSLAQEIVPTLKSFTGKHKIFGYLAKEEKNLEEIIKYLDTSNLDTKIFLRSDLQLEKQVKNITIFKTLQNLREIIPESSIYIHHGGLTSSDLGLRYGIPQLLLPNHLEHKVTSGLVMLMGTGNLIQAAEHSIEEFDKIFNNIIENYQHYLSNAKKWANILQERIKTQPHPLDIILDAIHSFAKENAC